MKTSERPRSALEGSESLIVVSNCAHVYRRFVDSKLSGPSYLVGRCERSSSVEKEQEEGRGQKTGFVKNRDRRRNGNGRKARGKR